MQALLSDGPLEGKTIGVDTGPEGTPCPTPSMSTSMTVNILIFSDLKEVAAGRDTAVYVFRDQQTL